MAALRCVTCGGPAFDCRCWAEAAYGAEAQRCRALLDSVRNPESKRSRALRRQAEAAIRLRDAERSRGDLFGG